RHPQLARSIVSSRHRAPMFLCETPDGQLRNCARSPRDATVPSRSCFGDVATLVGLPWTVVLVKHFLGFRLDTTNHCLWRAHERGSLARKAFDLLRYLIEHADRLVPQDEILEALWTDTYVNPEVVKKYILGIRKVLGDRRDKPEFIRTFPKRGYQFVAPFTD